MPPFFSIIIPTLNEEVCLPKILKDLQEQKEKNFEVIIVDASSVDKTKQKANEYKLSFPVRFYEINKKNVAYSRNFGAVKAQGEYLIFLDADLRINSSFIRVLKKAIFKRKGLVFIPYIIPDERDQQIKIIFTLVNFLVEFSQNLNKPFSSGGNIIIEKNFFNRLDGFDEKLFIAEDHNLIQKAYEHGVRAKFLPEVKVKFSLRRMRKEGQLMIFYKYLVATIHIIVKGSVKEKIFDYKMGGQEYHPLKKKFSLDGSLNGSLKQVRSFFRKYLS